MVKKKLDDKNRLPEADPNMKRLLDPDTAAKKKRFDEFKAKLKSVYPDAIPMQNLKSPEMCDQCEKRVWTRQIRVQKAIIDYQIFVMCDFCYPILELMCQKKQYRIHLIRHRPGGLG